ncbi:MAG: hypothetical protein ACKOQ2_13450, partial [Dolichospermum sp.]
MLSTIAKRIQSRLSRQGVKISLGDVKSQCELMINDIDNPSEIELIAGQEYFIDNASQLVIIDSIDLHTNEAALDTEQETALATATKSELVASTAGSLGIVLDAQEIS